MPSTSEIDQVGKREDLSDVIAVADAKATPITTMLPKGKQPENTYFEWQVDAYDTPKTSGVVDGKDVSTYEDAAKNRKKLGGRVQKFWRVPRVNTLAEKVSKVAGVASEFAKAKAKKTVEIKRDIESRVLSNLDSAPDDGDDQGYEFRGLGKWIDSAAQSDLPVPSAFRTPSASIYTGTLAAFTEDSLSAVLQSRYDQTGTAADLVLICGTELKRHISSFTKYAADKVSYGHVRTFNQNGTEGKIYDRVDIYEGDFGYLKILDPSSFIHDPKWGYIIDMSLAEINPHTMPNARELEDRGGGPSSLIEAILGLSCLNPLGHAAIKATA